MEILELAQQRKMFVRTKDRYKYPHKEAMKVVYNTHMFYRIIVIKACL